MQKVAFDSMNLIANEVIYTVYYLSIYLLLAYVYQYTLLLFLLLFLLSQNLAIFKKGDIFTPDHVLDICTLCKQHTSDLIQKKPLIEFVLSGGYLSQYNLSKINSLQENLSISSTTHVTPSDAPVDVVADWTDSHMYIDEELGTLRSLFVYILTIYIYLLFY